MHISISDEFSCFFFIYFPVLMAKIARNSKMFDISAIFFKEILLKIVHIYHLSFLNSIHHGYPFPFSIHILIINDNLHPIATFLIHKSILSYIKVLKTLENLFILRNKNLEKLKNQIIMVKENGKQVNIRIYL